MRGLAGVVSIALALVCLAAYAVMALRVMQREET